MVTISQSPDSQSYSLSFPINVTSYLRYDVSLSLASKSSLRFLEFGGVENEHTSAKDFLSLLHILKLKFYRAMLV